MAEHGKTGVTLTPDDTAALRQGFNERQNASDQLGRSSAPPPPITQVPPGRKLKWGLEASDVVFMFTGERGEVTQELINNMKKRGFTAFRKDVEVGEGEPRPKIFFKKKLQVQSQGGAL